MTISFQPMVLHVDLAFLIVLKHRDYCKSARIDYRQRNDFFIDLINGNPIDIVFKRFILTKCGAVENSKDLWLINVPIELIEYVICRKLKPSWVKLN